jgi:hypothetical protein
VYPKADREFLDRVDVLRHLCDLDLLLFFYRHPRAFLTSEQLAAYVGYGLTQIGDSLDRLIEAQLLRRSATQAQSARIYQLTLSGPHGGWLEAILALARGRDGRRRLREAVRARSPVAPAGQAVTRKAPRAPKRGLEVIHG